MSERVGLVPTVLFTVAWVIAGAVGAQAVSVLLAAHPKLAEMSLIFMAILAGVGGLVRFWLIADQIDYRRRGYRVRWISGNNWLYEERAAVSHYLPYVRVVMGKGYPTPCELRISAERTWRTEVPPWAQGRRAEIAQRISECHGAERGGDVRFVDE